MILLILISFLILELFLFKNIISLEYKGVVSQNNNLVINNLSYDEIESILDSKKMEIDDRLVNYEVVDIKEGLTDYTLKLKLDNYYLDSRTLKLKVILKEEKLYEFIMRKLKGE